MDSKAFISKSVGLGFGAGCLFFLGEPTPCSAQDTASTPSDKKVEFMHGWVQRLMENMDAQLDEETRLKLMESCGRACCRQSWGERSASGPQPGDLEKLLARLKGFAGEDSIDRKGNTIRFTSTRGGRCLCPLVQSAPQEISATYCHCSTGYVKEMFERAVGKTVDVQLLESVKRGGTQCTWSIQV